MENWSVAIAILVAVLVGASIPLMFQVWMTLQSARRVAERLDRVTARIEEGKRVDELMDALDGITGAARQLGNGVKIASAIGAAIGPAAAAAIQAWRSSGAAAQEEPGSPPGEEELRAPSRDGVASPVAQQKAGTEVRP